MRKASERSTLGFAFVIKWVLANTMGVGLLFLIFVFMGLSIAYGGSGIPGGRSVTIALFGLLAGLLCGGPQALVLRRVVPLTGHWILLTIIGSAAGLTVALFLNDTALAGMGYTAGLASAAVFGTIVGVCQWVVLRHMRWAAAWVIASAIGSVLGISTVLLAGLPYGIVTGGALFVLLRYSTAHGSVTSPSRSVLELTGAVLIVAFAIGLGLSLQTQHVRVLNIVNGHIERPTDVAFLSDGKTLASMDIGTVNLWNASNGELLRTMHGGEYTALAASHDRLQFAAYHDDLAGPGTGRNNRSVLIWNAIDGQELRTLRGLTTGVSSMAFAPDGQSLAIAGDDGKLELIGIADERHRTIGAVSGIVHSIAFTPDGTLLASASHNEIAIWDLASSQKIRTLQGHTDVVWTLAMSPDGRHIASGSWDHSAKIWDLRTGEALQTLNGHSAFVNAIAFSPDGRTLVTAASDDTIIFWDATSGKPLSTLGGHSGPVRGLAFSPDGRILASVSDDFTIRLWSLGN
jgi:WD domain, G-beta repeat